MTSLNRFAFLTTAVVFHVVYIFSIFDIYFVSPIVSGMRLFGLERPPTASPPADRLVLFVGDGLRADKAFQSFPEPYPRTDEDLEPRPLAPFLRSRVLEEGTFGVSHTRVPTESRPGHVALIAGLYEDVSAVATGWKLNPVHFDSVFNRSRHTWSWGSPDILPMFERGAVPGRVDAYTYEPEYEDYSQDATRLDYWVFYHVKDFFRHAATNQTLARQLRQDKLVFFLHLLGLDTNGHAFRPYSKEYLHNIQVVDGGVKEVTQLFRDFFADDRTAFVFTADHGMSDWGSHGDGHPDNTRTPLIAWGSGVASPRLSPDAPAPGHDAYSSDWGLDNVQRHDVSQADVATMMSHLIGTEFPANSVGKLPLSYLSADEADKARASLANAQQILDMYRVKEEGKRETQLRFKPFQPLSRRSATADERAASIRALIESGKYEEAIEECDALVNLALQGFRYLQTYDWLFLRSLVTVGYLGWIAYASTIVVDTFVLHGRETPRRTRLSLTAFSAVLVALYASFLSARSPLAYYLYALFPVVLWEEVFAHRGSLRRGREVLFQHIDSTQASGNLLLYTVLYLLVLQCLALSYIHREVLTGIYVLLAVWPLTYGKSFIRAHALLSALWAGSCLIMSSFTLLPAMKVENVNLILLGGVLILAVGLLYLVFEDFALSDFGADKTPPRSPTEGRLRRSLMGIQIGFIPLSMLVTRSSALSLQAKNGLPLGNQVVGWITLVVSLLMPWTYRLQNSARYIHRLAVLFLACAPSFVLLTISYEGLFYVAFSITLLLWVRLEVAMDGRNDAIYRLKANGQSSTKAEQAGRSEDHGVGYRTLRISDARVGLFFMVLLQSAFFSTGNVASISSFSLDSVYRLIPIFDPFSQGALLVLKLMIPFALLSANLGVLNKRLGVAPSAFFMIVMAASDILTLYFFWVVKDEGSWLEIGSTISHFAIASLLCAFVAGLEAFSAVIISGIEVDRGAGPDTAGPKEAPPAPREHDSKMNGGCSKPDLAEERSTCKLAPDGRSDAIVRSKL